MQKLSKKQATASRLSAVQANVSGWWEAPHTICSLSQRDFLPYSDFHGMRDFRETWQEDTLALARALQHCAERLGMPSGMLCDVAWDLQRCMVPLMCLEGDAILEALLLGATDNKPWTSWPWQKMPHFWVMILHSKELGWLPHALLTTQRRPPSLKVQPSWSGL